MGVSRLLYFISYIHAADGSTYTPCRTLLIFFDTVSSCNAFLMLDSPADILSRISRVEKARVDEAINEYTFSETVVFFIFSLQDAQTPDRPRPPKVDFPENTRVASTYLSGDTHPQSLQCAPILRCAGVFSCSGYRNSDRYRRLRCVFCFRCVYIPFLPFCCAAFHCVLATALFFNNAYAKPSVPLRSGRCFRCVLAFCFTSK